MTGDELIAALQRMNPENRKRQVVFERLEYEQTGPDFGGCPYRLKDVTSAIDSLGVARSATSGELVIHLFTESAR